MISRFAIKEFKEAQLKDWIWIKQCSVQELEQEIKSRFPSFDYKLKPFKHQLASLFLGMTNKSFLFFLDTGLGKAQPLDAKILTPQGWKLMKEIKVGDKISSPTTGKYSIVEGIFPQGMKEVFKVTFSDGSSTECCNDHLWKIITAVDRQDMKDGKTKKDLHQILALKDIKDKLYYNNKDPKNKSKRYFIPITVPIKFDKQQLCIPTKIKKEFDSIKKDYFKIDPYVVGVLLGDGNLSSGPEFSTTDIEIVNNVKKSISNLYVVSQRKDPIQFYIKPKNSKISNMFLEHLKRLGLYGKRAWEKFIPSNYLKSSIQNRIRLLQGLVDADGYVSEQGTVQYGSTSKQLIEDVKFLVQSLGGTANYSIREIVGYKDKHHKFKRCRIFYELTIALSNQLQICTLSRKLNRIKRKFSVYRAIKKVESIGLKEVQCIKLNNKDGLYLTDDFIVTHNTRLIIDYLEWLKSIGKLKRALVLVPNTTVVAGWKDEVDLYAKTLKMIGLYGTKEERIEKLDQEADLNVLTYTGLQILLCKKDKKTNRLSPNETKIKHFVKRFNVVAFDEIHNCKNSDSLTFRLCNQLSKVCEYRYGLTATPFGRNSLDLWAQFFLIDRGETLSSVMSMFRDAYFIKTQNFMGFPEYKFDKELEEDLKKRLRNRSITYSMDEADLDLPPLVRLKVPVQLTTEAVQYYNAALRKLKLSLDWQETKNSFIKCRQIVAGFVKFKDENEVETLFRLAENAKLEALESWIQSIPQDCKIVIFNEFTESGDMIAELLTKLKIKFFRLYSETTEKDKLTAKQQFHEKDCRVFLANSKSGNAGLNLQIANYTIFYESPVSPIIRKQAEKRIYRPGQTKRTFIYDMVAKGTVDERVLNFIAEGKNLFEALLSNPAEVELDEVVNA